MCSPDEICKNDKCEDVTCWNCKFGKRKSFLFWKFNYVTCFVPNSGLWCLAFRSFQLDSSWLPLKKPYRSLLLESYNLAPSLPRLEFLYRDRYPSTSRVDMQVDHIFLLSTLSYFKQDVIKCSKLFSTFWQDNYKMCSQVPVYAHNHSDLIRLLITSPQR